MRKVAIILAVALTLSLARGNQDELLGKPKPKDNQPDPKGAVPDSAQNKTIWSIFGTAIQLGPDPLTKYNTSAAILLGFIEGYYRAAYKNNYNYTANQMCMGAQSFIYYNKSYL